MRIFTRLVMCGLLFSKAIAQAPAEKTPVSFGDGIEAFRQHPTDSAVVILTFSSKDIAAQSRQLLQQQQVTFSGPEFIELPIQGVKVSGADIDRLLKLPGIIGIWPNKRLNGDLNQAVLTSRVADVRADATFVSLNGGVPITGRGVGVLVNDSGFDGDDTDIQGNDQGTMSRRIVQNTRGNGTTWTEDPNDALSLPTDTDQGGGHGSHCMGIVGGDGRKSSGKFTGVAPGAYLIGYGSGAGLLILDTEGGFEYVLRHARDYNIKVMSNSYGQTSDTAFLSFDAANPTSIATKALADKGVMVVFSAGNSGPGSGTITGNFKTAPWVLAVGNGLKTGPLASSSSRGRPQGGNTAGEEALQATVTVDGKNYLWENRPTVTAPGTDIVSVRATAGPVGYTGATGEVGALSSSEIPYYAILSGTSMACPHVAGIAALMFEANPKLEWRAIKAILQRTSVPMPEKKWESGEGYVNAHAAVAAAYYGLCDVPAGSSYEAKYGLPSDGSFGFATDTWKTCPIKDSVMMRIKNTFASIAGVQPACGPTEPPLTDPTGTADVNGGTTPANPPPQFDIKQVRFVNETATTFDVVMEVAGNLTAAPLSVVNTRADYFDAHFVLDKVSAEGATPDPQVNYIVSSYRTGTATFEFRLTVRSADGTTRPVTNATHYESISGSWDLVNNTITWTVPKAKLNVSAVPSTTALAGTRTGRAAKAGDRLRQWTAYIYERVGTLTPDGPGVYVDRAEGSCFKTLSVQ